MENVISLPNGSKCFIGKIYKFLDLEGACATLTNCTLKFSNPLMFNDPMDCNVAFLSFDYIIKKLGLKESQKLLINGFKQIIRREDKKSGINTLSSIDWDSVNQEIHLYKDEGHLSDGLRNLLNLVHRFSFSPFLIDEIIKRYKICCFSRNYHLKKSSLMWSHYADNHYGICLEFDIKKLDEIDSTSFKKYKYLIPFGVNYVSLFESFIIDSNEGMRDWVLQKLNIWNYEKEVRCFYKSEEKKNIDFYSYPKNILTKIIFGYNTKVEDIQRIKKVIKQNYDLKGLKFEKMGITPTTYSIKPYPFDIEKLAFNRTRDVFKYPL